MGRAENLTKPNIALTQSKGNALALAHGEGTGTENFRLGGRQAARKS